MPTPRTATTTGKHFRQAVLRRAQANGITHCPACGVPLDYTSGQRGPNHAEADHIIPHSLGGHDTPDNGRVLCQRCNQQRGNGTRHKPGTTPIPIMRTTTTTTW